MTIPPAESPEPEVKLALARAYLKSEDPSKGLALLDANPDLMAEAQASDLVLVAAVEIAAKVGATTSVAQAEA